MTTVAGRATPVQAGGPKADGTHAEGPDAREGPKGVAGQGNGESVVVDSGAERL